MSRVQRFVGVALALVCVGALVVTRNHLQPLELGATILGQPLELASAGWLSLLCLLPLLAWGAWRSLADLPPAQAALSLTLRGLVICTLVLAAARLSTTKDATRVSTVVVADVSDSISDADLAAAQRVVDDLLDSRADNHVEVVSFAARPRVVRPNEEDGRVVLERHTAPDGQGTLNAATHIQQALQLAYGLFPAGHLRRVLLLSDGIETRGNLAEEAARAKRFGVRIHSRALREQKPPEVAVRDLSVPADIEVGETFGVEAQVHSTTATRARLKLYQGPTLNGLDSIREVELEPGTNTLSFRSIVRVPGQVRYRLSLVSEGEDRFESNNEFTTTVVVAGRPPVLIVEDNAGHARHLAAALSAAEFAVDVRSKAAMPRTLSELERYEFFILSDVSSEFVSAAQMDLIERYVRDLGGGFLMAGGDNSFALGGYQDTRMEQLLPVRMESERRRDEHSLALALVIDCSGSMAGPKIELAKDAAKASSEMLGPDDSIAVVGFASQPARKVRMQSARNRYKIAQNIGRLTAQGGTAIFPALDMAFQDLGVTNARVKHVILLTDGQTRETGIEDLVQAMRAESITVSTVGLGGDVNRSLLQAAANTGGGRAYFTNDPHNIPRIFMRETSTVGRNSAVEEFFQPQVVERADFLKGLDLGSAPFLHGYVATQAKPRPAQVILQSDLGEPILARWRVGLGWSLAWTSDVKNRWSVEWLRWRGFGPFWGQLVREHMRKIRHHSLPMQATVTRGEVKVVVDAIGPDDQFMNGLESILKVEGGASSRGADGREHPLQQVAPGRYEARFELNDHGSFVLSAVHRSEDRVVARSEARLENPYPEEYAAREADVELLAGISKATGGRTDPSPAQVFAREDESIETRQDLWPRLVGLALALFLFDLLLRRVRLFDRGFLRPGRATTT